MKITVRPYADSNKPHLRAVCHYSDSSGKRRRKFFPTLRGAKTFAAQLGDAVAKGGRDAAALTPAAYREVLACKRRLEPYGATLTDAVNLLVEREEARRKHAKVALSQALQEFLHEKQTGGARPRTLRNLEGRLRNFCSGREAEMVASVTEEDCRRWIFRDGTARTQINRRLALSAFFRWASRRGLSPNVVERIDPPRADETDPEILSLEACRALLMAAQDYRKGEWTPYVVFALLAGIRPAEIERMTWSDADLQEGAVRIGGRVAKLRARRLVPLSENALHWLRPWSGCREGPVTPPGPAKNLRFIRKAAGIDPWPQDAARHTCISAWMALHGEAEAARWAGNSPDICHRFYKGLMSKEQAHEFFAIRPQDCGKVVSLANG